VGGAFLELLDASSAPLPITRVLVRDPGRKRSESARRHSVTDDLSDFLAVQADVVVEAIGGVERAAEIARATLRRGAWFVTANKALVAAHGPELADLARLHRGGFRFDASVGGGVPVVRTLMGTFADVPVRRISGILNGTANYLLTRFEEGEGAEEALATAQAEGYAEADPSRDLDGRDVADKAAVLAWVAWGVQPRNLEVRREGLPSDAADRARAAVARGRRFRLVADLRHAGPGAATVAIECREVPETSPMGLTRGVGNTVAIETPCGDYTLTGPGAGGPPTAAAMLADVRAAIERSSTQPARSRG
jgi:homoserine dehydrogenase